MSGVEKMDKLLLISNAAHLLEKERGAAIDNFDGKVCRFNLFEISPYEKYIGSRIDYILQRSCDDIPKRQPNSIEHCFIFITYCNMMNIMRRVSHDYEKWYGNKATVIDIDQTYRTHRKLKLVGGEKCSIGILAIDYFLTEGYDITLLGFDYGESFKPSHYFKRQPIDSKYHAFNKEAEYINQLREEGKIKDWVDEETI